MADAAPGDDLLERFGQLRADLSIEPIRLIHEKFPAWRVVFAFGAYVAVPAGAEVLTAVDAVGIAIQISGAEQDRAAGCDRSVEQR